ncbi:MAG: hypothetical protein ACREJ3_04185 [Polyangiaceae bacterium]
MLQVTMVPPASAVHPIAERVRQVASALGCSTLWARTAGPHVVLGLKGENAFARLTPLGDSAYGLSFRSEVASERRSPSTPSWEPLLLVDELTTVVEHALVGVHALPLTA